MVLDWMSACMSAVVSENRPCAGCAESVLDREMPAVGNQNPDLVRKIRPSSHHARLLGHSADIYHRPVRHLASAFAL